ncbi:MAG: RDD family protein [Chitinophagaceae bacterium]
MTEQTEPQGISLADELESFVQYEAATRGQRFVNWLIDNLFMRFVLAQLTGRLVVYILQALFPEYILGISYSDDPWDLLLISFAIGIFNYVFYYTICEKAFQGRTVGKVISGTRTIRNDGAELTFRDALLRSVSRLVPFEVFSGFGDPWHDTWTNTRVIKTRR